MGSWHGNCHEEEERMERRRSTLLKRLIVEGKPHKMFYSESFLLPLYFGGKVVAAVSAAGGVFFLDFPHSFSIFVFMC